MQGYDERKEKRSADHSEVLFFTEAQLVFPEKASTENLSSHGARLLTEQPSKPNAPITVRFPKREWMQARVVYCEKVPDKFFAVGIEFLRRYPL